MCALYHRNGQAGGEPRRKNRPIYPDLELASRASYAGAILTGIVGAVMKAMKFTATAGRSLSRGSLVRAGHRYLPRDSTVLVDRLGPMFASEIRKGRLHHRSFSQWRWHLDEVFVKINGETYYLYGRLT